MKAWLERHPDGEWLFPGPKEHLTVSSAWHVVKKYAWRAKVPDLRPHQLRYTCAKDLLRAGGLSYGRRGAGPREARHNGGLRATVPLGCGGGAGKGGGVGRPLPFDGLTAVNNVVDRVSGAAVDRTANYGQRFLGRQDVQGDSRFIEQPRKDFSQSPECREKRFQAIWATDS